MSHLVIARKYRPGTFTSVIGQTHVTKTLLNSLKLNKVAHAYVFSGLRGVGKTSIARIFAKALNCLNPDNFEPCNECTNCKDISNGSSLVVQEIDGASHNGVDHVRELIDSFRSLPAPGYKNKVYIIDEVHMLSTSAFNALLKSLEEPPPNTVFILATTEKHKIPKTVLSRCQEFDFKSLSQLEIHESLIEICKLEKIKIDHSALRIISRLADGSMRDAQSLLERVRIFSSGNITEEIVAESLGVVSRNILFNLVENILARNPEKALEIVASSLEQDRDPLIFTRDLVSYLHELLLIKIDKTSFFQKNKFDESEKKELVAMVEKFEQADLLDISDLARQSGDLILRSFYPRNALESLVIRLASRYPVKDLGKIFTDFKTLLEKKNLTNADLVEKIEIKETVVQKATDNDIVSILTKSGHILIAEQMKRLAVIKFEQGILEARGSDFSVGYLNTPVNLEKIKVCLSGILGIKDWKINLFTTEVFGGAEKGSIIEREQTEYKRQVKVKTDNLRNHESVMNIKQVFPGSVIEDIKLKDNSKE